MESYTLGDRKEFVNLSTDTMKGVGKSTQKMLLPR